MRRGRSFRFFASSATRTPRKYMLPPPLPQGATLPIPNEFSYDAIVVGGGHNGLTHAAYLARAGLKVLVLERRALIGGAAVTEEVFPGFHFSRGSYLAGLLRPAIIKELQLERRGFVYLQRTPSSFTPSLTTDPVYGGKHLMLGHADINADLQSIAQFSDKDARAYLEYEGFLSKVRDILQPLLDAPPPSLQGRFHELLHAAKTTWVVLRVMFRHRAVLLAFSELMVGPASSLLDRFFESDILKATLATDAVIGAVTSPSQLGSAYVLVHHVMGQCGERQGVWAYVRGGMGKISEAIGDAAREAGAEILCRSEVTDLVYHQGVGNSSSGRVAGVIVNGAFVSAPIVVSGASPYTTFCELGAKFAHGGALSRDSSSRRSHPVPAPYLQQIESADYSCGAMKINLAVNRLPNFTSFPSPADGQPGPMHRGTIHLETSVDDLEAAYREASAGYPATVPVVEMTIPSSIDDTLAPPSKHVVQLFVNYVPYTLHKSLQDRGGWDNPDILQAVVDRVLDRVELFAPGFRASIIHSDVLSPLQLERLFGLHGGNIHHGALSLNQLFHLRPSYRTPVQGLYLCASGTHPGGGVQGAPGRNTARVVLSDLSKALV